jgi:ATP-dependent DNA helicase RecQ
MTSPLDLLKTHWGYDAFRTPQAEIIDHVIAGHDGLALLPTGGGKSLCFQIPGLALGGLTLVISPLIALMKDQVERLNQLGLRATYLTSSLKPREIDRRLQGAMDGQYQFLYLAPERIRSDMFQQRLPRMPVKLLAVDEAHCISQWGYDFRPAYLEIHRIREQLPQVPMLALTASATPEVQADIIAKLTLRSPGIFRKSFRRDNLRYFILPEENVVPRIVEICRRTLGTGIIYVRTRRLTTQLAKVLLGQGIAAAAYHGGLPNSERDQVQQDWLSGTHRVMVATNAFGMGIDKPDVRFVIHHNLPFDLESYYQEAGRGGRDGQTALAIAFQNPIDLAELQRWNRDRYPSWEQLQQHYQQLCTHFRVPNQGYDRSVHLLDLGGLASDLDLSPRKLYASLRVLNLEGLVAFAEDSDDYGYLQVTATPESVWHYKQNQPSSQAMLDYLLRIYGGEAYTQEVRFLPVHWAMRFGWTVEELEQKLQRLVQHEVLTYMPATGQPTLRFLRPRHLLTQAEVNWSKYQFLQAQNDRRLAALIGYVENTEVCRSLVIQHYFGEKAHDPCGRCDVCMGRHQTKVNDGEFRDIQRAIMAYLHRGPASYRDTLLQVTSGTPAQREKVLRYLIDKQLILSSLRGQLSVRPDQ